ncbi:DUF4856 domain-containing protein [Balneola vulgaris]|uniref:DUF4856 domain-containing protein n=1 Tax=Balneola vulgaris TaxID=287535 RepID=UPI0003665DF6|nr:DUF4856 domain-containing protein [Balneola vulgaris]
MKISRLLFISILSISFISCGISTDNDIDLDIPADYTFTRNGSSSVSFSGQTTRIKMATELVSAMMAFDTSTEESLLEMFRNETSQGGDADPFTDAELNASTKSIKSKVAASADFYSANTTESAEVKADFEAWISAQVNEVFPNEDSLARPGVAGQIADGSSTRYVSAKGLEYNQLVAKGLIGALMTDQMLNNYLSVSVLDAGSNQQDNNSEVLVDGQNYTNMEHKWDEAYGYLFGASQDPANPLATLGDDNFLNKYLGRVVDNPLFSTVGVDVYNAFKTGRAAIVASEYDIRDERANIIRDRISAVIAIRAIYYLQAGKDALSGTEKDFGAAFHDLSEGYGFVYSLQFTRIPGTNAPFFTRSEVEGFLNDLMGDGENGLWDVTPQTLDDISASIAAKFNFNVEQAAS